MCQRRENSYQPSTTHPRPLPSLHSRFAPSPLPPPSFRARLPPRPPPFPPNSTWGADPASTTRRWVIHEVPPVYHTHAHFPRPSHSFCAHSPLPFTPVPPNSTWGAGSRVDARKMGDTRSATRISHTRAPSSPRTRYAPARRPVHHVPPKLDLGWQDHITVLV